MQSALAVRPLGCRLQVTQRRVPVREARPCGLRVGRAAAHVPQASSSGAPAEVDLESAVESFMKRQAEIESGAAFARTRDPDQVIGGDVVNEDLAQGYCRELFEVLKTLKVTRDMSFNEVKLIVSIEDPRAKERRAADIEDDRGVSRDEMAAALVEVAEGRIPKDRIALKCLYDEVKSWPFLDVEPAKGEIKKLSPPGVGASDYAALAGGQSIARPYVMGTDARESLGEKPQSATDMLPPWVGYGMLYGISAIPVLLVVGVVLVLFYNSLR